MENPKLQGISIRCESSFEPPRSDVEETVGNLGIARPRSSSLPDTQHTGPEEEVANRFRN
jgi:hypothetical protein